MPKPTAKSLEWPTLAMLVLTYAVFGFGTMIWDHSIVLSLLLTTLSVTQFSSLQHEVLHGHPFASKRLNEALVFVGITFFVPYARFRDTHLVHHYDPNLTDPYDDPEANYLDPAVWANLRPAVQWLLRANNTLCGRILLGPAVSMWSFCATDIAAIRLGNRAILAAWLWHGIGVGLVLAWLAACASMPIWAYVLAAYIGFGLLKIRTFLEHRAHEICRARSVIVEDRGLLALLFLNNNLHAVHHMHPGAAWYKLPGIYAARRAHYLRRNDAYVYKNYYQIFRSFLFTAKDPVPHPVWPVTKTAASVAEG